MLTHALIFLATLTSLLPDTNAQSVIFEAGEAIKPFKLTPPASGGNVEVTQAVVDIETNYKQKVDTLSIPLESWFSAKFTDTTPDSGYLTITGKSDINNYYRILNTVTFLTTVADGSDRTITWNLGTGVFYSPTKHLYMFVSRPGISFTNAQLACQNSKVLGMTGYLATVTQPHSKYGSPAGEMAFITSKLNGLGWLGAKDVGNDEWQWFVGPEKGLAFYSRCKMVKTVQCTQWTRSCIFFFSCTNKCAASQTVLVKDCSGNPAPVVNAAGITEYSNWAPIEPNNAGGEDFGHMYGSGQWNDFSDGNPSCEGYVCEYGGLENAPYVVSGTQLMTPGCSKYPKDQCATQRQCRYNADTKICEVNECFTITEEMACDRHPTCEWDYDPEPEHCAENHCMMYNKAAPQKCNSDPKCIHNGVTCVDKVCSSMRQCDCVKNTAICFWDPKYMNAGGTTGKCMDLQYATCPAVDLLFMLDASGSMKQYGLDSPRVNAFYRVVEEIRKWANDAPLTGHGWTADETNANTQKELNNARGFRLGLAAYGAPDCVNIYRGGKNPACVAPKANSASIENDHFTGKLSEFMDDLDWQEDFFVGYQTYLAPGLDMAYKMFNYPAAIKRQKVMLIIGDGSLTDQTTVISGGFRSQLVDGLKVKLFAIVLHQSPGPASESLKQIVSLPVTTYFRNDIEPETLRKSVLDVWCDPTSQFGAALPAPQITGVCSKYPPDSATCNDDTMCVFNMAKNTCDVSPCIPLCTEDECKPQQLCAWDPKDSMCKRKTCDDKITEGTCSAIDICQWDKTNLDKPYCRERKCIATKANCKDPCQWNTIVNPNGVCEEKKCVMSSTDPKIAQRECNNDPYCIWEVKGGVSTLVKASANILLNPSFEDRGTLITIGPVQKPCTTCSKDAVGLCHSKNWDTSNKAGDAWVDSAQYEEWQQATLVSGPSPDKSNYVIELDAMANVCVRQRVTLIPGTTYQFSYSYYPRPSKPDSNILGVYVYASSDDKATPTPFRIPTCLSHNPNQFAWQTFVYQFTAAAATYRIELCAEGESDGVGAIIDNTALYAMKSENTFTPKCREDKCAKYNITKDLNGCKADSLCFVNGKNECEEKWCVSHADEKACELDALCEWNMKVSPARCQNTECSVYKDKALCNADEKCAWDVQFTDPQKVAPNNTGVCVQHECRLENKECECARVDKCFWSNGVCRDERFYNCMYMDVMIMIDGSKSMAGMVGNEPNGFIGVNDEIRQWMEELPLTGTKKGESVGTSTGFRVGIVQFSNEKQIKVSQYTDGMLTGDEAELQLELDWQDQDANIMKGEEFVKVALQKVIDAFQPLSSPSNRKKVLLIFGDGLIDDVANCRVEEQALVDLGVKVITIGVVGDTSIPLSDAAAASLKLLASDPVLAYKSEDIDDIKDDVLDMICNPNAWIGSYLGFTEQANAPCSHYDTENLCARKTHCVWEEVPICSPKEQGGKKLLSCPNINCATPPNGLDCGNCKLVNGVVACDPNQNYHVEMMREQCDTSKCVAPCDNCTDYSKPPPTTGAYPIDTQCLADTCTNMTGCSYINGKCGRKVCEYKTQDACEADIDKVCYWDPLVTPPKCRVERCSLLDTQTDCKSLINADTGFPQCKWDTSKPTAICDENACPFTAEVDCKNSSVNCIWDVNVKPAMCRERLCMSNTKESDCENDQSADCDWEGSAKPPFCHERYCNYNQKTFCDLDKACLWTDGRGTCRTKYCTTTNQVECEKDEKCLWAGATCSERPCTKIGDEVSCNKNADCHWDVESSPAVCKTKECPKKGPDQTSCATLPTCRWNGTKCLDKKCSDTSIACECAKDKRCVWESNKCQSSYNVGCPAVDVVFILDGTLSMSGTAGRHPNGWYGLLELLQDWVEGAKLTDTDGVTAPPASAPGLRIGVVQAGNITTTPLVTTLSGSQGTISGAAYQVESDIQYMEDNFLGSDALVLAPAITKACSMLSKAIGTETRTDAIVMIIDGSFDDLRKAQSAVANCGNVKFFGIALEKAPNPPSTSAVYTAETNLKMLIGDTTMVKRMGLDDLRVSVLNTFCENDMWLGKALGAKDVGCAGIDDPNNCGLHTSCEWDPTYILKCPNPKGCPNVDCYEMDYTDIAKNLQCLNCKFNANNEVVCNANTNNPPLMGDCVTTKCMEICLPGDASKCVGDCEVSLTDNKLCVKEPCSRRYLTELTCDSDPLCEWDHTATPKKCRDDRCAPLFTKTTCTANDACYWTSTGACLEKSCYYPVSTDCAKDPDCKWDVGLNKCRLAECVYSTYDACDKAVSNTTGADCIWDPTRTPPKCREDACVSFKNSGDCEKDKVPGTGNVVSKCKWDLDGYVDDCMGLDNITCKQAPLKCDWFPSNSSCMSKARCREYKCTYTDKATCVAHPLECKWLDAQNYCVERACVDHESEYVCANDNWCEWDTDVDPPECTLKQCADYPNNADPNACTADVSCMSKTQPVTNPPGPNCVPKPCSYFKTQCDCLKNHDRCFFQDSTKSCLDTKYYGCSNLDIVFLVDASGSMSRKFADNLDGFNTIVKYLRQFVPDLPLTMTKAGTAATNSAGFRVGIVAFGWAISSWASLFGGQSGAWCTKNVGTKCRLSGDADELATDLTELSKMRSNLAGYTYLEDGINDAVTMLKSGGKDRRRVTIILGDGDLTDQSLVNSMRKSLSDYNIEAFAVMMKLSALDNAQGSTLRTLVDGSNPPPLDKSTHFMNIPLGDVKAKVLDRLCDPSSPFGSSLSSKPMPPTCSSLSQMQCNSWDHCEWDPEQQPKCVNPLGCYYINCANIPEDYVKQRMKCENCYLVNGQVTCSLRYTAPKVSGMCMHANCTEICGKTDCEAVPTCKFPDSSCKRKVCSYGNQTSCEKDASCIWDPYLKPTAQCRVDRCLNLTQEDCRAEYCTWNTKAAGTIADPKCTERKCGEGNENDCNNKDPDCQWSKTTGKCDQRPCLFTDATKCDMSTSPLCEFDRYDTGKCIVSTCKLLSADYIFPGVQSSRNSYLVDERRYTGFKITITANAAAGDIIALTLQAGYTMTPASGSASTNGVWTVTGPATNMLTLLNMLASATITMSGAVSTRTVKWEYTYTLDSTYKYYATNDHYYWISPNRISGNWYDAVNYCENMNYMGKKGYLVTFTTQQEWLNARNVLAANDRYWIGSNDLRVEGEWRWVTGPEANMDNVSPNNNYQIGLLFWRGQYYNGRCLIGWCGWDGGEPNQAGDEDYLEMLGFKSGVFNDIPNGATSRQVICEFGGRSTDAKLSGVNTVQASCASQPGICEMQGSVCRMKKCRSTIPKDNCNKIDDCFYDDNTKQCSTKCKVLYTEQDKCNAVSRCDWDEQSKECLRNCNDMKSLPDECAKVSRCELNGNNQCEEKCSEASTQAICASTAFPKDKCEWATDTLPQSCRTLCSAYTTIFNSAAKCRNDTNCALKLNGVCDVRCDKRPKNKNEAGCTADPECEWSTLMNTCVQRVCSYTDLNVCLADPTCKVVNGKCVRKCDYWLTNTTCGQDSACEWDPIQNECDPKCDLITNQTQCDENDYCIYDASGHCRPMCNRKYSQPAPCDADKNCQWNTEANHCGEQPCLADNVKDCLSYSTFNTSTKLGSEPMVCEWRTDAVRIIDVNISGTQKCVKLDLSSYSDCVIQKYYQAVIGMEGDYNLVMAVFEGDTCTSNPWQKVPSQKYGNGPSAIHYKQGNVFTWPKFPELPSPSVALSSYKVPTQSAGKFLSIYFTDAANGKTTYGGKIILEMKCPGACRPGCDEYKSKGPCENPDYTPGCDWDPLAKDCRKSCQAQYPTANDKAACTNDPFCQYFPNAATDKCQPDCTHRDLNDVTSCGNDPLCMWDSDDKVCVTKCSAMAQDQCSTQKSLYVNTPMCDQFKDRCDVKCELLTKNDKECNTKYPGCMWDITNKVCAKECTNYADADNCTKSPSGMCEFFSGKCQQKCEFRYVAAAVPSTSCTASSDCKWDGTKSMCTNKCDKIPSVNKANCTADHMCDFRNGACKLGCDNQGITTPAGCAAPALNNECVWDTSGSGGCYKACALNNPNKDECVADRICSWTEKNQCTLNCRNKYNSQATCITDKQCEWDDKVLPKGACKNGCSGYGATDCTTDGACEWDATKNLCVKQCSAKYDDPIEKTDCSNDAACVYNVEQSRCAKQCSLRNNVTCAQDPGTCYWANETNDCPLVTFPAALATGLSQTSAIVAGGMTVGGLVMDCDSSTKTSIGITKIVTPTKICETGYIIPVTKPATSFSAYISMVDSCVGCIASTPSALNTGVTFNILGRKRDTSTYTLLKSSAQPRTCDVAVPPELLEVSLAGIDSIKLTITTDANTQCDVGVWGNPKVCSITNASCEVKCASRWPGDATRCSNDVDCMWDGANCRKTCERITNTDDCLLDSMCEVDGQKQCRKKCSFLTRAACDLDADCTFDAGVCKKDCTKNLQDAPCKNDARCEWRQPANGKAICDYKCENKNKADCSLDNTCAFNNNTKSCYKKCELITDLTTCATLKDVCEVVNSKCKSVCSVKYPTIDSKADCDYDSDCMWDETSKSCDKTCKLISTESTCAADSMCEVIAKGICDKKCPYAYKGKISCSKQSRCQWDESDPANPVCNKKCDLYTDMTGCMNDRMCEWDMKYAGKCSLTGDSRVACSTGSTAPSKSTCETAGCCWDDNATQCYKVAPQCRLRCQFRFTDEFTCQKSNSGGACIWNVPNQTCMNDCSNHGIDATTTAERAAACAKDSMCDFINNNCTQKCEEKYKNVDDCRADPACMWKESSKTCTRICTQLKQTDCDSQDQCEVVNGMCTFKCGFKLPVSQGTCEGETRCLWEPVKQICTPNCTYLAVEDKCNSQSRCHWKSGSANPCRLQCGENKVQGLCENDDSCDWEVPFVVSPTGVTRDTTKAPKCDKECEERYTTKEGCSQDSDCVFTDNGCQRSCARINQFEMPTLTTQQIQDTCNKNTACLFTTSCVMKCPLRHNNAQDCNNTASKDCRWNPDTKICSRECSTIS
eukprot:PhF_6_TR38574/c2_g3_i1/m.57272